MEKQKTIGIRLPGYLAVYVGEKMKRLVISISYLDQLLLKELLSQAEEEFGYHHPVDGLTIPCREDAFLSLTSLISIEWVINHT